MFSAHNFKLSHLHCICIVKLIPFLRLSNIYQKSLLGYFGCLNKHHQPLLGKLMDVSQRHAGAYMDRSVISNSLGRNRHYRGRLS